LVIGGTIVPAGKYSLFVVPARVPERWRLIINKQTGQWGTSYDASQDLARVELGVSPLAQSVERFTITIDPRPSGGVLRLAWENTEASIPFTKQ
jgi:hypothetical protein